LSDIDMKTGDEALLEGLKVCLEETLGREIDSLSPAKRLVGDLGLDSLDLLDLIFRLERRFGVRINPKDFEIKAREALGGAPLIEDGYYTEAAVAQFKRAMPCVPEGGFGERLAAASLIDLFRVRTLMSMVEAARRSQGAE
jgi:acyl carrier protein